MVNVNSVIQCSYPKRDMRSWCRDEMVENLDTQSSHRVCRSAISLSNASESEESDFQERNPYLTHRNSPPAAYWVNDSRHSPGRMGTLPCLRVAEGKRAIRPGGNSTKSFSWLNIRCPPVRGLKFPLQKIGQRPLLLLPESVCSYVTTFGPKLNDAAVNTVFLMGRSIFAWCSRSSSMLFAYSW